MVAGLFAFVFFRLSVALHDWFSVRFFQTVGGLSGGLRVGMVIGLFLGFILGAKPAGDSPEPKFGDVSEVSVPNAGTLFLLRHAIAVLSIATAVSFGLAVLGRHVHAASPLAGVSAVVMLLGVLLAHVRGGRFVLLHYSIRLLPWYRRLMPLRYVRFNEVTERLFLIRHGGSYEFFHVTFRDYIASAHAPKADLTRRAN